MQSLINHTIEMRATLPLLPALLLLALLPRAGGSDYSKEHALVCSQISDVGTKL